jgi:hypothetical protein
VEVMGWLGKGKQDTLDWVKWCFFFSSLLSYTCEEPMLSIYPYIYTQLV